MRVQWPRRRQSSYGGADSDRPGRACSRDRALVGVSRRRHCDCGTSNACSAFVFVMGAIANPQNRHGRVCDAQEKAG